MATDEVYLWNKEANWYVTESGKSFDNPWHTDIYNYVMASTKASVGTIAEDAIAYGNPFKTIGESYNNYKDDGGSWGVAGFLGTGIKTSLISTYEDLKYGGQRRTNAMIGIWLFSSEIAKGGTLSKGIATVEKTTKEFIHLDTNALVEAIENGVPKNIDKIIGDKIPSVSRQVVREFLEKGDKELLRKYLSERGGRLAKSGSDFEVENLRSLATSLKRGLKLKDARVAASAIKEGAGIITRDEKLYKFLNQIGVINYQF